MGSRAWWLLCVACGGGTTPPGGDGGPSDGRQTVVEMPVTTNRNLDVLVVVDDSAGMPDKQANLRANFPRYLDVLNTLPGGLPDLHLGVVSTDMGTKGTASPTPGPPVGMVGSGGCAATGKGGRLQVNGAAVAGTNYIRDIKLPDGSRMTNYAGNLATVFGQMASLGDQGCAFEQPLHAMRAALANHPDNGGFLRPDALLQVIFVTDEDDCSIADPALYNPDPADPVHGPLASFRCTRFGVQCATGGETEDAMNTVGAKAACRDREDSPLVDPVAGYHAFLMGLKNGDARKVVVSALAPPPTPLAVELRDVSGMPQHAVVPSCMYAGAAGTETGDPAVRLHAFVELFERRAEASICDRDLSDGLATVARTALRALGTPCLEATPVDADDTQAGDQYDCIVEDVSGTSTTPIMPCDAANTPTCWRVIQDPQSCPIDGNLKLVVERAVTPPSDTVVRMRCKL